MGKCRFAKWTQLQREWKKFTKLFFAMCFALFHYLRVFKGLDLQKLEPRPCQLQYEV